MISYANLGAILAGIAFYMAWESAGKVPDDADKEMAKRDRKNSSGSKPDVIRKKELAVKNRGKPLPVKKGNDYVTYEAELDLLLKGDTIPDHDTQTKKARALIELEGKPLLGSRPEDVGVRLPPPRAVLRPPIPPNDN